MFQSKTLRAAVALALALPGFAFAQVADPAKTFSRAPDYSGATLSPTGEFVAVSTPDGEDKRALSMIKLGGNTERHLFRFQSSEDRWHNIVKKEPYGMTWTDDNRLMVYEVYDMGLFGTKFQSGNVYAVNSDAGDPVQLFGYINDAGTVRGRLKDEGAVQLLDVPDGGKGNALFTYMPHTKGNSKNITEIFSVDTHTGTRNQIESFADSVAVASDNLGRPRVNIRWDLDDVQHVQYRPTPDGAWVDMPKSIAGSAFGLWFFEPDNNIAYAEISENGEPAQLYKVDFKAGTREHIGGQPNQEITEIDRAGRVGPPVVLHYSAGKPKIDYLDPKSAWTQLHAGLMKAFPGELVRFVDVTRDENKVLFETYSDRDPGTYYLYDRTTNKPSLLFKTHEDIDPAQMSPTLPLEFKNRDGESIFAFLTLPQGRQGKLPLVVVPHGGPYGIFDQWSFDRDAQFFASLGYAVLRVNYRGSGGRGVTFKESTYKGWGTGIQNDITDGVKFVISQGMADPGKVCIYGASFGGYSAMMNPILNPGMYKCAIGYAGVYDIKADSEKKDSSKQIRSFWSRSRGDDANQTAQSPLTHIKQLDVPILLIHGKSDHNVDFEQFQMAEAALKYNGKTYDTLVKADEGHGFYKAKDQEEAYNRMKAFILKYNPPN
jgi:dipeptidyl aminopeptidase/acylaminoacyl peptidase